MHIEQGGPRPLTIRRIVFHRYILLRGQKSSEKLLQLSQDGNAPVVLTGHIVYFVKESLWTLTLQLQTLTLGRGDL